MDLSALVPFHMTSHRFRVEYFVHRDTSHEIYVQ